MSKYFEKNWHIFEKNFLRSKIVNKKVPTFRNFSKKYFSGQKNLRKQLFSEFFVL